MKAGRYFCNVGHKYVRQQKVQSTETGEGQGSSFFITCYKFINGINGINWKSQRNRYQRDQRNQRVELAKSVSTGSTGSSRKVSEIGINEVNEKNLAKKYIKVVNGINKKIQRDWYQQVQRYQRENWQKNVMMGSTGKFSEIGINRIIGINEKNERTNVSKLRTLQSVMD